MIILKNFKSKSSRASQPLNAVADNKRVPRVLNRKAKYFGRLDVLKLYPSTLSGASLTEVLRSAFLCKWTDSVGNDFPGTNC